MSTHIARIESAIRSHILDNEEDFLGSVGGVSDLSRRTEEFRNGVRELRRSFMRVRREVSEPHEAVRLRTQQLKNLHSATRLLKRALRFLAALRRLRAQEDALGLDPSGGVGGGGGGVGGGRGGADLRELAKAAQSLQVGRVATACTVAACWEVVDIYIFCVFYWVASILVCWAATQEDSAQISAKLHGVVDRGCCNHLVLFCV